MLAIIYTLDPDTANANHAQGIDGAMSELCRTLRSFEFERQQNGIYTSDKEDLANLFDAMTALKALPWFSASVRDIRAFRVEQWSDFTSFFKT
jgi:virulence-associated protein VapD